MTRRIVWGRRYSVDDSDKEPFLQSFGLRIANTAGTIQHAIVAIEMDTTTLGLYSSKINGAAVALANSPALDATTPFASGGGFVAARPAIWLFDTADQVNAEAFYASPALWINTTGAAPPMLSMRNFLSSVNGVTLNRVAIGFMDSATGADWPINTTNIPSGKEIRIHVGPIAIR